MEDKQIKDIFESMGPTNAQKDNIWKRIEAQTDDQRDPIAFAPVRARKSVFSRVIAVAAALVLVIGGMSIISNKTDEIPSLAGHVYAAESRITDLSSEEVLVFTGDPVAASELYVYAPQIYYLDDKLLVFGNGNGLILYDLAAKKVSGLIDMQAICSSYYNTDSIKTHVMVDGSNLIVYNTKSNVSDDMEQTGDDSMNAADSLEPWGFYHVFDLDQLKGDGSLLQYTGSGNDKDLINDYINAGAEYESSHYVDAWDNVACLQSKEMDDAIGRNGGSYSENAFVHKGSDGKELKSILVYKGYDCDDEGNIISDNGGYILLDESSDGEISQLEMNLGIDDPLRKEVSEKNDLPAYKYTGDDAAVGVICEAKSAEETAIYGEEGVLIPSPIIYDEIEQGDGLLVFGNFWMDRYIRQGNTLISVSGGEQPACYHLKKTGDSYEIISVEEAGDGEEYATSIKEFTEGHPGLYEKFMSSEGQDERVRKEMIKDYVEANGLEISYYKDFGWDPVKLYD